jgi:hypothetical protein
MSEWATILLISAVSLVIPAAIVVGSRVRFGALVVSAGASAAAFVVFWFLLGGASGLDGSDGPTGIVPVLVLLGGLLLMFAAWALALHASAQVRLWPWVGLLTVAGVATFAAVLISISPPDPCIFGQRFGPPAVCAPNPLAQLLVTAGYFALPAAALAYGLGFRVAASLSRTPPEGITVSQLGDGEIDSGSQPEITIEPL